MRLTPSRPNLIVTVRLVRATHDLRQAEEPRGLRCGWLADAELLDHPDEPGDDGWN